MSEILTPKQALALYRSREPRPDPKLLPCPFCGGSATIQPWHGGRKTKMLVQCAGEDCFASPAVTGETRKEAVQRWNERNPKYPVPDVPAMNKWVQEMRNGLNKLRRLGKEVEETAIEHAHNVSYLSELLREVKK
jgi:hypothetical protein